MYRIPLAISNIYIYINVCFGCSQSHTIEEIANEVRDEVAEGYEYRIIYPHEHTSSTIDSSCEYIRIDSHKSNIILANANNKMQSVFAPHAKSNKWLFIAFDSIAHKHYMRVASFVNVGLDRMCHSCHVPFMQ